MTTSEELRSRLKQVTTKSFRDRLLDRGLARGLIWEKGRVPRGAPRFAPTLTTDLLDYGYGVLATALQLRRLVPSDPALPVAFLTAGEAIEAAVHRGPVADDTAFHRLTAAVTFHLAQLAPRSFTMLAAADGHLTVTEQVLVRLLQRRLEEMHTIYRTWLLDQEHRDDAVADRLQWEGDVDAAVNEVLTTSFMKGLALFNQATVTGDEDLALRAQSSLRDTANAASELSEATHWWTATLAAHLLEELWSLSMWKHIPPSLGMSASNDRWTRLRKDYIQRLRAGTRADIELWPSQIEAAARVADTGDNLVVALPTGAGKTRIAELCILRALADDRRVVYVTPLRALSAQIERDLAETFAPLRFTVSALYGAGGMVTDLDPLTNANIVVSTPEKLDLALRNNPEVLNDVGLIVLDEGHMLGPQEREVRYEALVQRLLVREDALARRLVCLSALFPEPSEMMELVAWIRHDAPGTGVHSPWRPTRQRTGTVTWQGAGARLDVEVNQEHSFVPRFVEARKPPPGSRRRKVFPHDKQELTLATAWKFAAQNKRVLIYCAMRVSVEALGETVLQCLEQHLLDPLRPVDPETLDVIATGEEWLGPDHPAVKCLRYGVALHHGLLPRPFLAAVERLLRSGRWPVVVASPTLAQGVNIAASVVLVPSLWRGREVIPASEIANVAGRAGRPFVDLEGLTLHVVFEDSADKRQRGLERWRELLARSRHARIGSGLLQLIVQVLADIATEAGVSVEHVVEDVVTGATFWRRDPTSGDAVQSHWRQNLGILDNAIFALVEAGTAPDALDGALREALKGSLFERFVAHETRPSPDSIRRFLLSRTEWIWSQTLPSRRRAYYAAGVDLDTGQFLTDHLDVLLQWLVQAETSLTEENGPNLATAVTECAELIAQTGLFSGRWNDPSHWRAALTAWIGEAPPTEVIGLCDPRGVEVLQDLFMYRLPWAMEAVRVIGLTTGHRNAEHLAGLAAAAVAGGTAHVSAIVLLRSGLLSRAAALAAVRSTHARFDNSIGMALWLRSDAVVERAADVNWPTRGSHSEWLRFYEEQRAAVSHQWVRVWDRVDVTWNREGPVPSGTPVVLESAEDGTTMVLDIDYSPLGVVNGVFAKPLHRIVRATVEDTHVMAELFGPSLEGGGDMI